jgi:hypothetical protein
MAVRWEENVYSFLARGAPRCGQWPTNLVRHRISGSLAAAILSLSVLFTGSAQPAFACNPGRPVSSSPAGFAGTQRNSLTGLYGVKATLEVYPDSYVQGSGPRSWVWDMLTRPKNSSTGWEYWAQAGWATLREPGWIYPPVGFVSWTDDAGHYYVLDDWNAATGDTWYTYWAPSSKRFSFFRNSTLMKEVAGGWTPKGIQLYGETHNTNNQMPGDTNNHVTMSNAYYILQGETSWRTFASAAGSNNDAWYGTSKISNSKYEIWDRYCSAPGGNN